MVRTDQVGVPAVGCFRHEGSWLDSLEPIAGKALADLIRTHAYILVAKLPDYPSGSVTALMFMEDRYYLLFNHSVGSIRLVSVFVVPLIETASIDFKHLADHLKRMIIADCIDKSIHNCHIPRLKIPKAFFKISRSCSVRRSSTFKRSISANELFCDWEDNEPFLPGVVLTD